ncbi:MAG: DegT/DnrJ/EryC1/StrS family aminotransferase [Muribaculaceae bacterium]|nr:DegT/DnrJ/EryC1/StrS family aminotransferase [Muribaculaceae bacterium]
MRYPFLSLRESNDKLMGDLERVAGEVIRSGSYLRGRYTSELESKLAEYCGAPYCVATSNGLDSLRLIFRAYMSMGILFPGDEVIVPANTYIASVLAITENCLIPVFVEPNPVTMNLDTERIEECINMRTRAILTVHLYGNTCYDENLKRIAKDYDLKLIEDNAQAFGAKSDVESDYGTWVAGSLGDAAALSFYPTKNLGALGDAGAVVTHDKELADCVRAIANYGSDTRYHNIYKGLNCRIDELQAAFLLEKLKYIDGESVRRRKIADIYSSEIDNPLIMSPLNLHNETQVWHQYVVRTEYREEFVKYLKDNGVGRDIHYAVPPHKQPCYLEYADLESPITEMLANQVVSIPIANVSEEDAHEISRIINAFTL